MSSVAKAAKQGKLPFKLLKGVSTLSDLADGASSLSVLMQAGGLWYYFDPTNGSTSGDGLTAATANSNLETVYALLRDGYNDGVVFIGGATSYQPSTAGGIVWSKSFAHLIGATNSLPGMGQRARIVNTAANDLSVLFTLSGSGCMVANIQFFDGKDSAADGACVIVSGVRNRFNGCEFRSNSTTSTHLLVSIDNTADMRDVQFNNCLFFNYSTNWATGITDAIGVSGGGATVFVIIDPLCQFVGVGMGVASTATHVYGSGAAPNAGFGISTQPTT